MTAALSRYEPSRQCPRRSLAGLAPDAALASDDRTISYIFSDESVGRDGHTINNDGWSLTNFRANPIAVWNHSDVVIGRVTSIGPVRKELRGSIRFAEADLSPFADSVFRMTKAGYLNATSVSWLPIKWTYSNDRARPGGIDFLEQELLEVSAVAVPALPTALATARDAGIDVAPFGEWAARELETRRPSSKQREVLTMVRSLASSAPRIYHPTGYAERAEKAAARAAALLNFRANPGFVASANSPWRVRARPRRIL
jgi:HK97 family phage prohead protease